MNSKWSVAGWVTVGVLAGTLTTMQFQASARGTTTSDLPLEEMQQLAETFAIIKADYVSPVDEKKMITDAIGGMVAGLDPHSQYFDKKAFKEFHEMTSGRFVGVGIQIEMEDGLVKVVSPIEHSPAYRAGLKSGDLITKIDDTFVKGLTMEQAVRRIRGEPGTKVTLMMFRKAESRSFTVALTREEILEQSVYTKEIDPGYVWVHVSQFQERTVDDFVSNIAALYKQDPKIKGIVLDLRNDPGGYIEGAVAIAAAFLPADSVIVSTKGQIPDSNKVYKGRPTDYSLRANADPLAALPPAIKSVPLVVLVNEASASASEIVSGALKDYKRGVLMGAQTFGKGSVQTVLPLQDGAGIKITTARYYTPNGTSIQAKGIVPDVMLDETAEGNLYGALRPREADLDKHITSGQGPEVKDEAHEKAREEAMKRLEENSGKNQLPPRLELGSSDDFQLRQALNRLEGKPVVISKTMTERPSEDESTPR